MCPNHSCLCLALSPRETNKHMTRDTKTTPEYFDASFSAFEIDAHPSRRREVREVWLLDSPPSTVPLRIAHKKPINVGMFGCLTNWLLYLELHLEWQRECESDIDISHNTFLYTSPTKNGRLPINNGSNRFWGLSGTTRTYIFFSTSYTSEPKELSFP